MSDMRDVLTIVDEQATEIERLEAELAQRISLQQSLDEIYTAANLAKQLAEAARACDRLRTDLSAVTSTAQSETDHLRQEIERLRARLAVKCEHPSAESCASLWQADTNQRQLASVDPALCDEFQWGADTCEKLAQALVAARESRDKAHRLLREAILRDGIVDDRWFEEAENAT